MLSRLLYRELIDRYTIGGRHQLGSSSKKKTDEDFNWRTVVETEEEVFRKYLGNKICKEKWLYLGEREETNENDSNDLAKVFGSGSIE